MPNPMTEDCQAAWVALQLRPTLGLSSPHLETTGLPHEPKCVRCFVAAPAGASRSPYFSFTLEFQYGRHTAAMWKSRSPVIGVSTGVVGSSSGAVGWCERYPRSNIAGCDRETDRVAPDALRLHEGSMLSQRPCGLAGGGAGQEGRNGVECPDGSRGERPHLREVLMNPGDVLVIKTLGSGG